MSRWNHFLSVLAVAASLVVLGYLVLSTSPVWPALVSGIAAISMLVLLAVPAKPIPSADPSFVESSSPSNEPAPSSFLKPSEPLEALPGDDPLANKPWLNLIEESVDLYDELDRLQSSLDAAAQDLVDHCRCRLLEILERSGVSILADDSTFDPNRHQVEAGHEIPAEGTPLEATLSPGFAVGRRVFRRARVKLAPSLLPSQEPSP